MSNHLKDKVAKIKTELIKKVSLILFIFSISLFLHTLSIFIPNNSNIEARKISNIIHDCKIGWFSIDGICKDYNNFINEEILQKEKNLENKDEITINYPCGESNKNCKISGFKDYLNYFTMILDFLISLLVSGIIGKIVSNNKKYKIIAWTFFILWNCLVLLLIFFNNKFMLFPSDIMRQVIEVVTFSIVFKINTLNIKKV